MRKTYIVVISIIVLLTIITLGTYAMFTQDINIGEFVNLTASTLPTESNISEYERITIPASESRTIDLNITNSTSNSLYYGVWYEMIDPDTINSNIKIGKLKGSVNATIGQLASNGNITVQICIVNNSNDDIIVNIGVGYSSTNSLNLPTGRSLVTGEVQPYDYIADKIIELAGDCTSWSSGFSGICATSSYDDNGVTKYHDYRYIGTAVNNWVKFNDDMYQIIGVFDSNSHGVTGQNLVKLISANTLTGLSWGTRNEPTEYTTYYTYASNWTISGVKNVLNQYYLNATDTSSIYKSCANWTYFAANNESKTMDCSRIVGYGIQSSELRDYVQPVTWYLKGYNSNAFSKQDFYTCERSLSTTIDNCTSGNQGSFPTNQTNTKIGLMYVSDYLYASGYRSSSDTTTANYHFGIQNWLYNGSEWSITPYVTSAAYVFAVGSGASGVYAVPPYAIRPTFYLKSQVYVTGGTGTFDNPYTIDLL